MSTLENRVGEAVWQACADHDIILVHGQQRDIALAAISAIPPFDEAAWLIELRSPGAPEWWSRIDEDGVCGWSNDANKAIRFCRAQDAQAIIDDIGWTEAVPTEHMWCEPRQQTQGT